MNRRKFILTTSLAAASGKLLAQQAIATKIAVPNAEILPSALKKGDKIMLIAPGGAVFNEQEVTKAVETIKNVGYIAVRAEGLTNRHGQFAGTDDHRANQLLAAFKDKEISAIVAMRGGSGCARILNMLDLYVIKKNPKILMGFSDLTSLLQYITLKTGLTTFHGPVGYSTWNTFSLKAMENLLLSKSSTIDLHGRRFQGEGVITGRLFGGNLRVFTHTLGTEYEPPAEPMILFIEDVEEEPYSIDRSLVHIRQWRNFKHVKAMIFGQFRKCEPEHAERSLTLQQVIEQFGKDTGIPITTNAAFGHVLNKITLPIGVSVNLNLSNSQITLNQPCVY